MPFRYLHGITMEDIAFEATGDALESLFMSAADAVMQIMIEELDEISPDVQRSFKAEDVSVELLLYKFLNEFVYYKDKDELLLRCPHIEINRQGETYHLNAILKGCIIDRARHRLKTDIKAVTLYRLKVTEHQDHWDALVVVDV